MIPAIQKAHLSSRVKDQPRQHSEILSPKEEHPAESNYTGIQTADRRQWFHKTSSLLAIGLEDPKEDLSHGCAGSGKQVAGFHTGAGGKVLGLPQLCCPSNRPLMEKQLQYSLGLGIVLLGWDPDVDYWARLLSFSFCYSYLDALESIIFFSPIHLPWLLPLPFLSLFSVCYGLMLLLYHHTTLLFSTNQHSFPVLQIAYLLTLN